MFYGKGDIFIPFSNYIPEGLKEFLCQINDIKYYNVYFISISNNKEIEDKTYSLFTPFFDEVGFNSCFLKANSLYGAYSVFLQNSYLDNKYFIDLNKPLKLGDLNE